MISPATCQLQSTYSAARPMLPLPPHPSFIIPPASSSLLILPVVASDYILLSLLIPFLILTLSAIGLNLLVGYCGQISIGHAAFMAVGAYAAYNIVLRAPGLNFLIVLILSGLIAAAAGMIFGIPSLRIKG